MLPYGWLSIIIGGVADHVHILFLLSKNHALKKIVEELKVGSSKWIKTKNPRFAKFHWQNGYGGFSVSQSNVADVRKYIANQEEHHRTLSFEDEYMLILERHGIEFDRDQLFESEVHD